MRKYQLIDVYIYQCANLAILKGFFEIVYFEKNISKRPSMHWVVVCLCSTSKVIWRQGHILVLSDRLEKPGNEPVTPGLQGQWFIHKTTTTAAVKFCSLESPKKHKIL